MNRLIEIWKPIIGNNEYSISNLGRVIGKSGNIRKLYSKNDGYQYITIKRITYTVHKLVANHFIDNPESKKQINHINGIKTDNRITNLEWVTASENRIHAYKTGLQKKTFRGDHPRSKSIIQYSLSGDIIRKYDSISGVIDFGYSISTVSNCLYGRDKNAKGYVWKFA